MPITKILSSKANLFGSTSTTPPPSSTSTITTTTASLTKTTITEPQISIKSNGNNNNNNPLEDDTPDCKISLSQIFQTENDIKNENEIEKVDEIKDIVIDINLKKECNEEQIFEEIK